MPEIDLPDRVDGPDSADSEEPNGDDLMAATEVPASVAEQAVARQLSTNSAAADHHQAFNKILDLNYEMDRKIVSLAQSLGVREVTSQSGQAGIPLSGSAAGK